MSFKVKLLLTASLKMIYLSTDYITPSTVPI